MRKLCIASVYLFLFFSAFLSRAEVVDKILVVVNDEVITQGDLDRILYPIYMQYRDLYSNEELAAKLDEVRRNVLERMIQDKLLLCEARKINIEAEKSEVDEKISELKKRFTTTQEFKETLESENITLGELEKKYTERIMIDKLVDLEIRRRVAFSPSEILAYYEAHKKDFEEPEKVKLETILIRFNDGRSEEEARSLAEGILMRLQEGGGFSLLAKEYSDGPYRDSGGDMGWVKKGELMETIDSLVFDLDKGEISGVLETNLGFHIFKVEDKTPENVPEFQQVKNKIEQIIFNKKFEEKFGRWLEELKKNAYIAFR